MLRLLEHYTSTQGEGPRVGVLTQFVRFAGCNLKCPKWPCDSQFAIDPAQYRAEQTMVSPDELASRVRTVEAVDGSRNICFTGGEPFLQKNEDLVALVRELSYQGFRFEVFTNGTFLIPASILDMSVAPVLDWKLPGSGETSANANRIRNVEIMKGRHLGSIKFTVVDKDDFELARALWLDFLQDGTLETFVGPVWNKVEPQQVVDWIREYRLPWRLNIQAHNYIYGAQTRGT